VVTKDEALAFDLALEALENTLGFTGSRQIDSVTRQAITAIKQARSAPEESVRLQCAHCGTVYADGVPPVVPVQENTMIYKTFEQWKSGNVLEHGVPRTEYYSEDQLDLVEMGWGYGYDAGRAVEQALDKMAENARELGLDYEPVQEPSCKDCRIDKSCSAKGKDFDVCSFYVPPPAAQRQWVGLTDEELVEAMDYWSEDCRSAYGGAHAADDEYVSMISTWRYIEAKLKEKNT